MNRGISRVGNGLKANRNEEKQYTWGFRKVTKRAVKIFWMDDANHMRKDDRLSRIG